jgi:hypothetical protein
VEDAFDKDSDLAIPAPSFSAQRLRRPTDESNGRMLLIAGAVLSVLVTFGIVWGLGARRSATIPVIEADSRPMRVKPDNPGGMQVPGSNDAILSGQSGSQLETLAGPPETPDPQALRAQQQAIDPPPPVATTSPLMPASLTPPTAPAPPPASAAAPPPPIAAAPIRPAEPRHVLAPPPRTAEPAATRGLLVQLGALGSEAAARVEWERLSRHMPDLLGGRQPQFTRSERDGHVFWRVRTGGFSDNAEAVLFCERVRTHGSACSVATF